MNGTLVIGQQQLENILIHIEESCIMFEKYGLQVLYWKVGENGLQASISIEKLHYVLKAWVDTSNLGPIGCNI